MHVAASLAIYVALVAGGLPNGALAVRDVGALGGGWLRPRAVRREGLELAAGMPRPLGGAARLRCMARRLDLPVGLRSVVLELFPLRAYLVAAAEAEDALAFVWEAVVSPGGVVAELDAEFLHELRWQGTSRAYNIGFVPGSEVLMGLRQQPRGGGGGRKDAVFWDARTGRELFAIPSRVIAVSPRGDLVATELLESGEHVGHIWNISSGAPAVVSQLRSPRGRFCVGAAFAPGGDYAAAVCNVDDLAGLEFTVDSGWELQVWDVRSGETLCSGAVPRGVIVAWGPGREPVSFDKLYFDGRRVAICGFGRPASFFEVALGVGGCSVAREASFRHCEDAFLPGNVQLRIGRRTLAVLSLGSDGENGATAEFELPLSGEMCRPSAIFAPDGRTVAVGSWSSVHMERRLIIWPFASGGQVIPLDPELRWPPAFSADAAVLAAARRDLGEAEIVDLASGRGQRLCTGRVAHLTSVAVQPVASGVARSAGPSGPGPSGPGTSHMRGCPGSQ